MENFLVYCVIKVYRMQAASNDITANLYFLFGNNGWAYQKIAKKALKIRPGHSLFVLAGGTGFNFPPYQKYVASKESIFGVNITAAILAQVNAAICHHPHPADVIFSTQTSSLALNSKSVLESIANTLNPKWRLALLKLQLLENWLSWLAAVALNPMKHFVVTDGRGIDKPWEAIQRERKRVFGNVKNISTLFLRDKHYFWEIEKERQIL